MRKKLFELNASIQLRAQGLSIKEISKRLGVSKGSVSLWVKDVVLDEKALKILEQKAKVGVAKGLLNIQKKRELSLGNQHNAIKEEIEKMNFSAQMFKLLCSFLYWGEGGKTGSSLSFINSDPELINTFLFLLRESFSLDERKFRCLIHVHEYHNEGELKKYWSELTQIPVSQFTKSYFKKNSGKNIHEEYKGTLKIKYYDASIFRELKVLYREFFNQKVRPVVQR